MKFILIFAAACCALLAADGNSDTAKIQAKVQVVAPVKIKRLAHIDFGSIVVDDYYKPATVQMRFKGVQPNWTANPASELLFDACAKYRASAPHSPGIFEVERDALVAPTFGGYLSNVKVEFDQTVVLSGGHGGDVQMVVDTDLPAEDFIPANPVAGVLYSRFQVGGKLLIPAQCLGYKEGPFHVSVTYQ